MSQRKDVKTHNRAETGERTVCGIALDGKRAAPIAPAGEVASCGSCAKHRAAPAARPPVDSLPAAG